MPKYTVTLEEVVRYTITLDANDEVQAADDAEEILLNRGPDGFDDWGVESRRVVLVLPARTPEED